MTGCILSSADLGAGAGAGLISAQSFHLQFRPRPSPAQPADTGRSFANYLHSFALFTTRGYMLLYCSKFYKQFRSCLFCSKSLFFTILGEFEEHKDTKKLITSVYPPAQSSLSPPRPSRSLRPPSASCGSLQHSNKDGNI